ncbi:hypothetical protein Tco_0590633 [Tanacetum coccineum]
MVIHESLMGRAKATNIFYVYSSRLSTSLEKMTPMDFWSKELIRHELRYVEDIWRSREKHVDVSVLVDADYYVVAFIYYRGKVYGRLTTALWKHWLRCSGDRKESKVIEVAKDSIKGICRWRVYNGGSRLKFQVCMKILGSSLINLRVASNAINARRLPLALLFTHWSDLSREQFSFQGGVEDKLPFLEQPIPAMPVPPAGQELLRTVRKFHTLRKRMKDSLSLILVSLRKEYDSFVQNYNMHCMGKTGTKLHAMLKLHEQTLPPKDVAPALHAIRAGRTGYVFVVNGGDVDWKSTKKSIFETSSIDVEYITAFDASKKAVWIQKFIYGLGVVPTIEEPIGMYCDNTGAIAIAKDHEITKGARHFCASRNDCDNNEGFSIS